MALPPATEIKAHFHILATFKSITECLSLWPQQFLRTGSLDEGCDLSVLCSKPGRYTLCLFLPKLASYTEEPITALDWASGSFSSLLGLLGVRNTKRAIAPNKKTFFAHSCRVKLLVLTTTARCEDLHPRHPPSRGEPAG